MFFTIKLCTYAKLFICIKTDLALNNLQKLICHKTKTNKGIIYLLFTHHHHHVVRLARISLTLSLHVSLSFIAIWQVFRVTSRINT